MPLYLRSGGSFCFRFYVDDFLFDINSILVNNSIYPKKLSQKNDESVRVNFYVNNKLKNRKMNSPTPQ